MSPREEVANALLEKLKELVPSAEASDILFFGGAADVSSPLPKKYGLDITPETVYNIRTTTVFRGIPLFSDVWESGGFLNLTVSREVWEIVAGEAADACTCVSFDEAIEISSNPRYARALLIDAAQEAREEGELPPADPILRKAFRFCLMADTESRKSIAAKAVLEAVSRHRRAKTLRDAEGVITKKAALAMAAALDKNT